MNLTWTVISWICIAGGVLLFLVGIVQYGRRVDERNYGRAEAAAHVESLRDFLPSHGLTGLTEAAVDLRAVDAAMRAGAEAR